MVFEHTADSSLFFQFVCHLVAQGFLEKRDAFVVDNYSIQIQGESIFQQEDLFSTLGILMIILPSYHPELNPTELGFNTFVQRLRIKQSRSVSTSSVKFEKRLSVR